MDTNYLTPEQVALPDTLSHTLPHLNDILQSFNLPRNIIASDEEIVCAWRELPREIMRIPEDLRDGFIVRMCIATSVGLFDGAINYIWNAVILTLKKKIRNFGFSLIGQTLDKKFEENDLNNLMDSELLDLCYKLELLSEDGYFFLNQCRDIRNNFSSAHPSIAQIDDRELVNFISRCCKYGITYDYTLVGVNVSDLIASLKGRRMDEDELSIWNEKLSTTFPAQRQLLLPMMMGLYCDPDSTETTRLNCLKICVASSSYLDDRIKSSMLEQYNKYFVKGDNDRCIAAKMLFEKMQILDLLSDAEQNAIVKNACRNLLKAHLEFNNFYNEPPFAKRLLELTFSLKTPKTMQLEYVTTVLICYVGNPYGVSHSAVPYYEEMIKNFSPREIEHMINLLDEKSLFSEKIKSYPRCKQRYREALELIEQDSMSSSQQSKYTALIRKLR